jgi:hypothetical protein
MTGIEIVVIVYRITLGVYTLSWARKWFGEEIKPSSDGFTNLSYLIKVYFKLTESSAIIK